jgi:hypothetical protein
MGNIKQDFEFKSRARGVSQNDNQIPQTGARHAQTAVGGCSRVDHIIFFGESNCF